MAYDAAAERVRRFFESTAASGFDTLYDREGVQRVLRPSLTARRDLALAIARELQAPSVLDIGCGSARLGVAMLKAGIERYVGIDFSERMLALARLRLERFGSRARLLQGDFATVGLEGTFDLLIALGFFEYLPDPDRIVYAMREHSHVGSTLVASFTTWDWVRGPYRWLRYRVINDCPIRNYTLPEVEQLLEVYGFDCLSIERITHCYLVVGRRAR